MVNTLINKMFFTLVILLLNSTVYAAVHNSGELILFTDKSEGELGRPIRVDLYAVNLKTKISDIDLSVLNKNFGVVVDYAINDITDKRWPGKKIQILKFKIYPRTKGALLIPKIYSNKISSQEKTVLITSKNVSTPSILLPKSSPYEREQFTVLVSILSSSSTSRLSIDKEVKVGNNFEGVALPFERSKNKDGVYRLQIGWTLTAVKNGKLNLTFPPIEYSVSGVSRKKFYLTSTRINIKSLPRYLSPTIPVGKISIHSILPKKSFLSLGSIFYWEITLKGNLNNSYKLPPILRQLKSNHYVKFLPVNSTRDKKFTSHNLSSEVLHSIPFKALKSGFLDFPKIKLQYFDPTSGKINTISYKTDKLLVLGVFWKTVLILLTSIIFIYIFKILYYKLNKLNFSKIKKEQAIQELQRKNLREAIKLLTEAESWPNNLSIIQWGEYWKNRYQVDNDFNAFIKTLSSHFYSAKEKNDLNELSLQLLNIVKNKSK